MVAILSRAGTIYYVDGFAGPGTYLEDSEDGSPLLAARHARELSLSNRQYELQCINVESDHDVFRNLQDSTSELGTWVENLHGNFGEFVIKILNLIESQPALFFLDPLGVKGLEWNSLLPILERPYTTELLIRFDTSAALRHTGSDPRHHATFNAILGEDTSEYWRKYRDACGESSSARRDCLTKAYEDKLREHFDFVGRIPISSSDDSLKYFLLFATRKVKGMQVMNDVFYKMKNLRDRTLDKERRTRGIGRQMNMFEPTPEEKTLYELEVLKKSVRKVLECGETYTRDELRGQVASRADNFGRFSGSHFTAVLGGRSNKVKAPKGFESLKSQIEIKNGQTPGNDKAEISLKRK